MRQCRIILHQLDLRGRCECLTRQVVSSGAEATCGDDDISPTDGISEGRHISFKVIADGGVKCHRHADFTEPLAEPLRVRIESLAAGQLVAYGNDLGTHF
jgi:hypothetical protein